MFHDRRVVAHRRSSKLTRARADAGARPGVRSRLTGCSFIPALGVKCKGFNVSGARLVCGKTFYYHMNEPESERLNGAPDV